VLVDLFSGWGETAAGTRCPGASTRTTEQVRDEAAAPWAVVPLHAVGHRQERDPGVPLGSTIASPTSTARTSTRRGRCGSSNWVGGRAARGPVTVAFPQLAAPGRGRHVQGLSAAPQVKDANVRGLLAAYVADAYRAGRRPGGLAAGGVCLSTRGCRCQVQGRRRSAWTPVPDLASAAS